MARVNRPCARRALVACGPGRRVAGSGCRPGGPAPRRGRQVPRRRPAAGRSARYV